ncbi:MAG TPA: LytTR family DNA-binding domain-containing protein [Bacteroidia bacterium]|jgi:two-component system LytT family response regulator|nr:LytTR family DNA-binding domain-containing protein [Bacteroidia bacterium]
MLNALIINSNKVYRESVESLLLKKIPEAKIVASTEHIEEARIILETCQIDLLFLDIMIGEYMGFELLNSVKTISCKVVFTTMNNPFALRVIKYSSFDHLLLPANEKDFNSLIDQLKKQEVLDTGQKLNHLFTLFNPTAPLSKLALTTGRNEIEFIDINSIIYCQAEGFYTTFHMENQQDILVSKNLKEYEKQLPANFIRIHKSFLINKNKIKKIIRSEGGYIVMNDQKMVPMGHKKEFFIKYLTN